MKTKKATLNKRKLKEMNKTTIMSKKQKPQKK